MKKYFVVWILLILTLLPLTACDKEKDTASDAVINQDVIQVKEFEVSTDLPDSNTTATGNVYVQKSQDHIKITIVAAVVVGENDWGGVSFCIPQGWAITSALSSYPDGRSNHNAAIWSTADTESEWKSFVEIGHEYNQISTGGGTGTVVIELTNDEDSSIAADFKLLVSTGSELKDGMPVVGTASTSVQLDYNLAK